MQAIIELLTANGYEPDGHTQSDTFKVVTANSYPMAGAIVTTGGRQRFKLPGTNKRVTVGKRLACVYESENKQAKNFQNFKTSDVEGIKAAIISAGQTPGAEGER